jgi:hypothetical protein
MSKSDGSQFLKDAFNVSMQVLVNDEEESKSSNNALHCLTLSLFLFISKEV